MRGDDAFRCLSPKHDWHRVGCKKSLKTHTYSTVCRASTREKKRRAFLWKRSPYQLSVFNMKQKATYSIRGKDRTVRPTTQEIQLSYEHNNARGPLEYYDVYNRVQKYLHVLRINSGHEEQSPELATKTFFCCCVFTNLFTLQALYPCCGRLVLFLPWVLGARQMLSFMARSGSLKVLLLIIWSVLIEISPRQKRAHGSWRACLPLSLCTLLCSN